MVATARRGGPFISINNDDGNNSDLSFEPFRQIVSFFVVLNIVGTRDLPQSSRFSPAALRQETLQCGEQRGLEVGGWSQ